jgi:hypothetical protein
VSVSRQLIGDCRCEVALAARSRQVAPASRSTHLGSPFSSRLGLGSVAREVKFATPPPSSIDALTGYTLTRTLRLANSGIALTEPARSSSVGMASTNGKHMSTFARITQGTMAAASQPTSSTAPAAATTSVASGSASSSVVLPRSSPRRKAKGFKQLF